MLSGLKDDLVPKEHMRALWEAVAKRGEKKTSGGSEYKVGLERAKYMEFENGGHSEWWRCMFFSVAEPCFCLKMIRAYRRGIGLLWRSLLRAWASERRRRNISRNG